MKMASPGMTLLVGVCLVVLAAACEEGGEERTATRTATATATSVATPTLSPTVSSTPTVVGTPEATPMPVITLTPHTSPTAQTTPTPEATSAPEATPTSAETPTSEATPSQFIVPTPRPADIPRQGTTLGSPDAPLTIVEYSDFLCPFCARAALNTLSQMEEEYVGAGKVKLVFKHLVVHGQEAAFAAGAAECASEQDAFWEYHDMLFLNAGSIDFSIENLKQFAEELGLDTGSFNTCLDSESYMDKVAADAAEARGRGVNATPTFFVGQTQIVGAKPYEEFKTAIEDQLAELGETS